VVVRISVIIRVWAKLMRTRSNSRDTLLRLKAHKEGKLTACKLRWGNLEPSPKFIMNMGAVHRLDGRGTQMLSS
jgi:hypothetical protein